MRVYLTAGLLQSLWERDESAVINDQRARLSLALLSAPRRPALHAQALCHLI